MGMQWLNGGMRVGDLPLNMMDSAPAVHPYFGGSPLAIDASGLRLALAADDQKFVGVAVCSSSEDRKNGNASFVTGTAYLRFMNASVSADSPDASGNVVEGAPYDTALTFVPSDLIYIDANGKWTNVAAAGKEKGIVVKGNTVADDSIEVILYPTSLRATA